MIPPFFRVRTLATTTSTNEDVKRVAIQGEPEGLVIRAERQTAGRGRHGRVWESPEGNLYATVLLRPEKKGDVGAYSFMAALAVQGALQQILPDADVKLKWPNDVLVGGKKISGLLLETSGASLDWLVIGVGINVASHPEKGLYPTTSLAAEGAEVPVEAVLEAFLTKLDHWRKTFRFDGFWPLRRAWLARAQTGPLRVALPQETLDGQFGGLDETGRLILRLADGTERFIDSGDVFFH